MILIGENIDIPLIYAKYWASAWQVSAKNWI